MRRLDRFCARVSLAAACVLMAAAAGPAFAQKTYEIKIGFVTVNDSNHFSSKLLKAALEKRTGGKLKVSIFPAAQLGTIPRQLEGIQLGTQAFFFTPPGFFQGINPAFQAPDAPGMFDSHWHQHLTLNHPSVLGEFSKLGEKAGIVPTYLWCAGVGAIASREPIRTLADLEGKKLRRARHQDGDRADGDLRRRRGADPLFAGRPVDPAAGGGRRAQRDHRHGTVEVLHRGEVPHADGRRLYPGRRRMPASRCSRNCRPISRPRYWEESAKLTDTTVEIAIDITTHWEKQWTKEGGEVIDFSDADREEFFRRAKPLGDKILGSNPKIAPMYNLIKAAAETTRAAAVEKMKATMMRLEKK